MIKVISYGDSTMAKGFVILYADTKDEVPSTGAETAAAIGLKFSPSAGSGLYTAKREKAVLKSTDEWEWGDDE